MNAIVRAKIAALSLEQERDEARKLCVVTQEENGRLRDQLAIASRTKRLAPSTVARHDAGKRITELEAELTRAHDRVGELEANGRKFSEEAVHLRDLLKDALHELEKRGLDPACVLAVAIREAAK